MFNNTIHSNNSNAFNTDNVNLFFSDNAEVDNNEELNKLMQEFYNDNGNGDNPFVFGEDDYDLNLSLLIDYSENNTVKQLLRICDYYGITKDNKLSKSKKIDIVNTILIFENDPHNREIVMKRKRMWHYINELKNDPHMKQFIFWS
jgi:hypothetical protein